jgi:hypothetical protein
MNQSTVKALTPKEAIKHYPALGCEGSLANLRSQRRGPKFFKVGRKVVYKPADIEDFLFREPVLTRDSIEAR